MITASTPMFQHQFELWTQKKIERQHKKLSLSTTTGMSRIIKGDDDHTNALHLSVHENQQNINNVPSDRIIHWIRERRSI
jgi:hypothetical protein